VTYNLLHTYRIIEFFTVFSALADMLICKQYKQSVKFEESGTRGFGFKLVVKCCGRAEINSGSFINTGFEINIRIVFVMQLLGIGREGINIFSDFMNMRVKD